ncbi:hypothetical protein IE81DRAFT_215067 [Ceraceosorus guamensis]|uniref:Uncharacterized protein n=1 Tax=Ceraceosorus guamensis TaxID=1522189 RepID=A0A316VSM1_9BASI|nr:hypothetical protein IE81DRAFT_215067 [Ceraceosorus guamensis]PWN40639.1 hypothetical protein IE81DRAFT_215067 [Ceraceosorus guamensis]
MPRNRVVVAGRRTDSSTLSKWCGFFSILALHLSSSCKEACQIGGLALRELCHSTRTPSCRSYEDLRPNRALTRPLPRRRLLLLNQDQDLSRREQIVRKKPDWLKPKEMAMAKHRLLTMKLPESVQICDCLRSA